MELLDGLALSKKIKIEIESEVSGIVKSGKRKPFLTAVLVGDDGASQTYVNSKIKDCKEVGYDSGLIRLPSSTTEVVLLEEIRKLNLDPNLDGFIVQLPLPIGIDQEKIIHAIDPNKDVDGFHPENFGKMALGMDSFIPATPFGILKLLERNDIETKGKEVVVIGRSRIVGLPISILLGLKQKNGNATVTLVHSHTKELEKYTKQADIIVTALGVPNFLKGSMIKKGAAIVDVGITRVEDTSEKGYHLAGDVDAESVSDKASWLSPVPGGVGPMTRAMLLLNTLQAYKRNVL